MKKIFGLSFITAGFFLHAQNIGNSPYAAFGLGDVQNQNKTTIKINSKTGYPIASKVDEPTHESIRKEMDRGRLLFYVTFKGGTAYLDLDNLRTILGIEETEF